MHLAAGLASRGHSLRLVSSFLLPADAKLPSLVPGALRAELERRRLPSPLTADVVTNTSLLADVLRVITNRSNMTAQTRFLTDRMVLQTQREAIRQLKLHRPDIVFGTASMNWLLAEECERLEIPFATYLPQPSIAFLKQEFPELLAEMHHGELPRKSELNSAEVFVASSALIEESIRRVRPDAVVIRQPLGFEVEQQPEPDPNNLATRERTNLVYAGRLPAQKRVPDAIEATRILREEHGVQATLTLYSSDTGVAAEMIRELHAEDYVSAPGSVSRERLHQAFARSHAFLFPSVYEGFGLVVPEALAAGLPVITTNRTAGADLEIDGVAGSIVPANDPRGIADAVLAMIEDPERQRRYRQNAPSLVKDGGWDSYASAVAEKFEQAAQPLVSEKSNDR